MTAIRSHNARVTVGDIGNQAVPSSAPISATVLADGQLRTPEEFGGIALRTRPDGSSLYLRDVARVEFGGSDYSFTSRVNGKTATGMAIKMAPGSNAVATVKRVRATMDQLAKYFPPGVSYQIPYETASFVQISIQKVVSTLIEAGVLVFFVMWLFLQNIRVHADSDAGGAGRADRHVPRMLSLGMSINVLTMFGLVLAIGILVDDAIVVVENVERMMAEEGLPPREATARRCGRSAARSSA